MEQTVRAKARPLASRPDAGDLSSEHNPADRMVADPLAGAPLGGDGGDHGWMLADAAANDGAQDNGPGLRTAVVVLGMHRSGTSALSRLFSLWGCDLPANLMLGRAGNEAGHWESETICALNDAALDSAGSDWRDWAPLHDGWFHAATYAGWVARARAAVRDEFGVSSLFVMKDPRQCRLAPLWFDALAAEGVAVHVALTLRHPWEVAESLRRRDGLGAARAHLLWLTHMLGAEYASRGCPRVVVRYDDVVSGAVLDQASALGGRMGVVWPRLGAVAMAEAARFVDPSHRHHHAHGDGGLHPSLTGWAGRVFAILSRWAIEGEDARDHATLDAVREDMAGAAADLARMVEDGEAIERALGEATAGHTAALARLAQAEQDEQEARAQLEQKLAQLAGQLDESTARGEGLTAEMGRMRLQMQQAERDALCATEEAMSARAALDAALMRARDLEQELDQARQIASEREAGLIDLSGLRDALIEERRALVEQGEALQARLAQAEAGREALIAQVEAGREAMAAQQDASAAEREAMVARIDAAKGQAGHWRAQVVKMETGQDELTRKLRDERAWVFRLAGERAALEQRLARMTRALDKAQKDAVPTTAAAPHAEAEPRQGALRDALAEAQLRHEAVSGKLALLSEHVQALEQQLAAATEQHQRECQAHQATQEAHQATQEAARASEQAADLTVQDQAARIAALEEALVLSQEQAEATNREMAEDRVTRARAEQDLAERYREIATLTIMLREQVEAAQQLATQQGWLRAVWANLRRAPEWWGTLPAGVQRKLELRRLARAGLFDGVAYVADNADVASSGIGALDHYILHGMAEGRSAGGAA